MTLEQATRLASQLRRIIRPSSGGKLVLTARVVQEGTTIELVDRVRTERPDYRVVFEGGRWGSHSVALSVSDRARVLAHWVGYVEAHGRRA